MHKTIYLIVSKTFMYNEVVIECFEDLYRAKSKKEFIEDNWNKFSAWFEMIEEVSRTLNHDRILDLIENQTVPREWKMQCFDYKQAHPEYKISENHVNHSSQFVESKLF